MIEEALGWIKTVSGVIRLSGQAPLCFAAYNLSHL